MLSAQGVGDVGNTVDNDFVGISPGNGFDIFVTTSYSVAAHTPITLVITTFNQADFAGGVSFVDTHTWDCTTGLFVGVSSGAAIPTLSAWGVLAMAILLSVGALLEVRRRRRSH